MIITFQVPCLQKLQGIVWCILQLACFESSPFIIFAALLTILQPHYEKVAKLFNGPDAVHPGIVLMTRVDCALKVFILSSGYLQSAASWK